MGKVWRLRLIGLLLCVGFSTSYAVTFTSQYNGNGSFDILYEGQLPIALALNIALPSGLTTDATHCTVNPYYNFFPDWVFDNFFQFEELGDGHPIANPYSPGSWDGSVSSFSISMAGFTPYTAYETDTWGEPDWERPIGNLPLSDLNWDGYVDLMDIILQNELWLCASEFPGFVSDINADGIVDIIDVGLMNGQQWLSPSSSGVLMTIQTLNYNPSANYDSIGIQLDALRGGLYIVPEPATLALLALGSLALNHRKKQ